MKMLSHLVQILSFSLLTFTSCVEALYLGNPSSAGAIEKGIWIPQDALIGLKLGYQVDIVLDRRLKSYGKIQSRIDTFRSLMNQGVITLSMADRLEVYGSVGSMEAWFSHRPLSTHLQRQYQTGTSITAGGGGRILAYEGKYCAIGIEGSYQYAKPPLHWTSLSGTTFTAKSHLHYQEWQAGLGISKQIDIFIPYLAIKYSNVAAKVSRLERELELPARALTLTNRDHVGAVVGCTFTTGSTFDLTLESRFIDEQALSAAANLRF